MNKDALWAAAQEARTHAYAPYSKFPVGAAVAVRDGRIFIGCNVENSSFGLTSCAERNAIYSAISAGADTPIAVAVVGSEEKPTLPCGACRQVMEEFGIKEVIVGTATIRHTYSLDELLPAAFTQEQMK